MKPGIRPHDLDLFFLFFMKKIHAFLLLTVGPIHKFPLRTFGIYGPIPGSPVHHIYNVIYWTETVRSVK